MSAEDDRRFMALALGLGARGLGRVWPNPAVGCVIAGEGRILGRGWTQAGGRPHAEPLALAQAGAAARGATAYVSLEPCAHHGATPPCTDALIAAGVARVVTAAADPDPRVAGRGHALLRAAGIEVTEGVLAAEAERAHRGFFSRIRRGRPWLALKLAQTLDGRIATAGGESRWITGPEARRHVHALRMRHDAVMVGAGTARADDPELTVRDLGAAAQPVRVVLDARLTHSPGSRLGRSAGDSPVWLCHGPDAPEAARQAWADRGAQLIACATGPDGRIVLADALARLGAAGLTRLLCEGGAALAAALVAEDLADELICYSAGTLIGGDGLAALGPLGLDRLAAAPRFRLEETATLGGDLMHRWLRVS